MLRNKTHALINVQTFTKIKYIKFAKIRKVACNVFN